MKNKRGLGTETYEIPHVTAIRPESLLPVMSDLLERNLCATDYKLVEVWRRKLLKRAYMEDIIENFPET